MRGWRGWAAAVAAGAAVGGAAAQPPANPAPTKSTDPLRAADPLGAVLADAKAAFATVRDYTCTFTRQERVTGVLGEEQVGELKARTSPVSIAVRLARPVAVTGLSAVYVAGKRADQMKVRNPGLKNLSGFTLVSLDAPNAFPAGRHPVTGYGVAAVLDRLAHVAAVEKALNNQVEVYATEYRFDNKPVTRYEILTRRPHTHRYAHKTLVYVDAATKLPVRWEAHDAPRPGTTTGDLLEAHSYTDLKLNVGVGDAAFE